MANGDSTEWKRPSSVPYPSIWRRFESPDKKDPQKIRKFRVQDAAEKDVQEAIIKHMTDIFLEDEPTCNSLNLKSDAESLRETQEIWRHLFTHQCALVCFEENDDGTLVTIPGTDTPYIVGCNMTFVSHKGEKNPKTKGDAISRICEAMDYVASSIDTYAHYGVNELLYAFGLSVDPAYRGMGVGMEILKARNDMGMKVSDYYKGLAN
uniref:Putative acetyltransferase rhodnius prolixus n=1 Tax=Xenopsylla cheopis TaxID=163159 RepID=A0A6M2DWY6_XENCH